MFINDCTQLQAMGFKVTKTKELQTVVEHSKPFLVKGTVRNIPATLNEDTNTYTVTFSGYPVQNVLQESIYQPKTPLLAEINVASNVAPKTESVDAGKSSLSPTSFGELAVGKTFRKLDETAAAYVKVDDTTYKMIGNTIGSVLENYMEGKVQVFTEMFDEDFSALTPEQKQDIVNHAPAGLSDRQQFIDAIIDDIDNIAGLETIDDEELEMLLDDLFALYAGTRT